METKGIEPSTSWLQTRSLSVISGDNKEVTSLDSARCPARCTESEETANADPLAGFVASLTPEQRQRLADLLAGNKEGGA